MSEDNPIGEIAAAFDAFLREHHWFIGYTQAIEELDPHDRMDESTLAMRKVFGDDATPLVCPMLAAVVVTWLRDNALIDVVPGRSAAVRRAFVRLREAQDCDVCGIGGATVCMRMEMDGKWASPCLCDPCAVTVKLRSEELAAERAKDE